MKRKKGVSPKQVERIRELSKEGKSANQIQKNLSREGLGLRRKTILKYIRKSKHQKSKANTAKYTPRKYRKKGATYGAGYSYARRGRKKPFGVKQIAEYGSVNGESRRIQVYGYGNQLYQVMQLTSRHPPRKQFLTISARELLSDPNKFLSEEYWDARPRINS